MQSYSLPLAPTMGRRFTVKPLLCSRKDKSCRGRASRWVEDAEIRLPLFSTVDGRCRPTAILFSTVDGRCRATGTLFSQQRMEDEELELPLVLNSGWKMQSYLPWFSTEDGRCRGTASPWSQQWMEDAELRLPLFSTVDGRCRATATPCSQQWMDDQSYRTFFLLYSHTLLLVHVQDLWNSISSTLNFSNLINSRRNAEAPKVRV